MISTTFFLTALAASLTHAIAGPAVLPRTDLGNVTTRDFDLWAQFCNDKACSEGCGESVAVSNPGCLNENGRQSIMFHGQTSALGSYALVVSPSGNCPCQDTCRVLSDTQCMDISSFGGQDQSFRFNGASQGGGTCDANNC
ncbi:hypothetical protein C8R47DRAFT_742316 [Mycena vitilis]|nr:hypothetical protein C8R47DRAFT_742316 [Mycena vitilis]